jgi:hypothetical protein
MEDQEKPEKITVKIPRNLKADLKQSAKQNYRSFNGELIFAIEQYLKFGK